MIDVDQHPYLKVLGRDITSEDESVPVGGYQYELSYTPTNPQTAAATIADNPIYVHVADPTTATGLGANDASTDGFLTGNWETVGGSTLGDDDKFFEGLVDEDPSSTKEWGDDDDKIGLLLKLNVLGSDSATNLQVVTNSTASEVGTGHGGRTVRVGSTPVANFAAGTFFALGADINIVVASAAPVVSLSEPDGVGDVGNTSYLIKYDLTDSDDDLDGNLTAALYAYPSGNLKSVQDIRIFGTLIADENDVQANNADGTGDFEEGPNRDYKWDDPPDGLKTSALFASILRVPSGSYYIYLVADDSKNPPVFAVSPGKVKIEHTPVIQQIDPIAADTVDTGVRTGLKANPYDLDFSVVDYDSDAKVQLFYASASGITSVSATGTYPNQSFVLGKSLLVTRGTAITSSTSLSSQDREFSWDVTSPLVEDGTYFLYAGATDSTTVVVDNSSMTLVVQHSPSFTFFEPAKDTQRQINSGSQSVFTIQWQKGPGDEDIDDEATIDLYFSTDDPSVTDHSTAAGAPPGQLIADGDTGTIIDGGVLTENADGPNDIYVWDLRNPNPGTDIPVSGQQVWLYAIIKDDSGNITVARGGSLVITHSPTILLKTRLPEINQGDMLRIEWDDYMVDDGSGTDDASIRLYASRASGFATLKSLEDNVVGAGGADNTFIVNSSNGAASGTITQILESDANAFTWDTKSSSFSLPEANYSLFAGISADPTFFDNTSVPVSRSSNLLLVKSSTGAQPNMAMSPNKLTASAGDILTFEVLVQSSGVTANAVSAVVNFESILQVQSPGSPFTDLGNVFSGGSVLENSSTSTQVRFSKTGTAQVIGSAENPVSLASFQLKVTSNFTGPRFVTLYSKEAAINLVGRSTPLTPESGMSVIAAELRSISRGRILAQVLLEGRSPPIGNGDHSTLLDVHLRLPGSTTDIVDDPFRLANDDNLATTDSVEVNTTSAGDLTLLDVPAGRYVLAVKDTSHLSGRTDTIVIRNGESLILTSDEGLFASDIRGDPSFLLELDGRELKAGDVTEDNEVDEDDINAIDAAWGSNPVVLNFARADLNNDQRVGVEDLAAAISNISNSTGFGAPPVFKEVTSLQADVSTFETNQSGLIVTPADGFDGEWVIGQEVPIVFAGISLEDMAAYGLDLTFDPAQMEIVGGETIEIGRVFSPNPAGYFSRFDKEEGRLSVAAARRGKKWSANGQGDLLKLYVRLYEDGFPTSLQLEANMLSSTYHPLQLKVLNDPAALALPKDFSLEQNYPNPFNPITTIPFRIPAVDIVSGSRGSVIVSVDVYNALGQKVRTLVNESLAPGYYREVWDGRNSGGQGVGTGMYFYRLRVGDFEDVQRMTLIK